MDVKYRFNGFTVDPVRRLLFGPDAQPVALKPRVFDTLLFLLEHRGELLEKQRLLDAIWPNVVVEENNLNQAISTLRRVFGETRDDHRFIVTEPGRGYRFVASVATMPAEAHAGSTAAASELGASLTAGVAPERTRPMARALVIGGALALLLAGAFVALDSARLGQPPPSTSSQLDSVTEIPDRSVAVLPFVDLSASGDRAWLVDGLTEEILNSLAQLPDLKVPGRTSSFQFRSAPSDVREIAERLGVAHVLEGSVRLVGDELRVTAQLIRASDGFHLWSNTYDGSARELLDFQRAVAERVAGALEIVLDERLRARMFAGGTRSVEAFEAYQQGSFVAREAIEGRGQQWDALPHFDQALLLDARYALAGLGKAAVLQNILLSGPRGAPYSQAEALEELRSVYAYAAANATTPTLRLVAEINLESVSPTWHRMPGLLNQLREVVDLDGMLLGGDGAVRLPVVLSVTNEVDLWRALAQHHVATDPLAVNSWLRRATADYHAGDYAAARSVLAEARRIVGRAPVYDFLDYNMARREGKREDSIAYLSTRPDPGAKMFLAAVRGDYETALRMAAEAEQALLAPNFGHTWLLDTYYEVGATEQLRALVKRIDDSPQGTAFFMQLFVQAAGLAFDLDDTPDFAAKLAHAGIDPASHMRPLPRLSTAR